MHVLYVLRRRRGERRRGEEERTQCEGATGYNVAGLRGSEGQGVGLREKRQKNGVSRSNF